MVQLMSLEAGGYGWNRVKEKEEIQMESSRWIHVDVEVAERTDAAVNSKSEVDEDG